MDAICTCNGQHEKCTLLAQEKAAREKAEIMFERYRELARSDIANNAWKIEAEKQKALAEKYRVVLELIAAAYNRSRGACERLASEALKETANV